VKPAEAKAMTGQVRTTLRGQPGFTLVEMMVVVTIITVLAAMAIANYIRMQEHAKTASCTSNQRNIHQAATIYASEKDIPDGAMDIEDLAVIHAVAWTLCECPSSHDASRDDYTLVWLDDLPRQVVCDIKGGTHLWEPR
jgi:prepilin-type N-terminal cleavage/methylation domain-containing protein